nr:immunoglobulin heavy chain junction region [Mus musculus]
CAYYYGSNFWYFDVW